MPKSFLPVAYLVGSLLSGCTAEEPSHALERVGVIEGFYGDPWSHQDRLDMLGFMGDVGLNMYIYAPKDDPYHRERWREPYPAVDFARLEELVDSADAHAVEFWYAISPGGTIAFSSESDYATLVEKIEAVRGLGVSRFGLFLDDVPMTLSHVADQEAFQSLVHAHAALINRLAADLASRRSELSVTPTTYTNAWGDTTYLRELGSRVDRGVPFFWTGPDVASPTITADQARGWAELIGDRPLWLWDNYPVNDYARWRPFLGPFPPRASDLSRHVSALLANPMNEAHASMIPLATLAEFALDLAEYDPGPALQRALAMLYGEMAADMFEPLLDAFGGYGWEPSPLEPLHILRDTIDVAQIDTVLQRANAALSILRSTVSTGRQPIQPIVEELAPFVDAAERRLRHMRSSESYVARDGKLIFRNAGERISLGSHTLLGPSPAPRATLRRSADTLLVTVEVTDPTPRRGSGTRAGTGDHVQLIVDVDPGDAPQGLTSSDLVIIVPRPVPGAELGAYVGGLQLKGFMSKWLADNERLTMSEFLLSSFAREPAGAGAIMASGTRVSGRGTGRGYRVDIAIPSMPAAAQLSLAVTDRGGETRSWALGELHYPANPSTFVRVAASR